MTGKKKPSKRIRHKFSKKRTVVIKCPHGKVAARIETPTDCKIPILIHVEAGSVEFES